MMAATAWSYFKAHSDQPDNPIEKLVLTGSSTVAPLASEIAKSFESLHPNVRIDVQTGGSSRCKNNSSVERPSALLTTVIGASLPPTCCQLIILPV
jgi:ABC-type phosphate transport system substrate-binding protein